PCRAEADDYGKLSAIQDPRELIAAEVVGAERKGKGRRLHPVDRTDLVHPVGREPSRKQAADEKEEEDRRADCADRFLARGAQPETHRRPVLARWPMPDRFSRRGHYWYLTFGSSNP